MAAPELIELEHEAWRALSTSGDDAAAFYERILADRVLMLLPGGLVLDDRAEVIESVRAEPWSSVELIDERVLPLGDAAAVVAYRATAQRGDTTYRALFTSTYHRNGDRWQLVVHQQTPI